MTTFTVETELSDAEPTKEPTMTATTAEIRETVADMGLTRMARPTLDFYAHVAAAEREVHCDVTVAEVWGIWLQTDGTIWARISGSDADGGTERWHNIDPETGELLATTTFVDDAANPPI